MHLIHLRLASKNDRQLPPDAASRLMARRRPQDRLEHVSLRQSHLGDPTFGLFFSFQRLADAENAALRLALRLLSSPAFAGFSVEACGAALIPLTVTGHER
ncbi:hypothetical protein OG239_42080 (plasmid) [Streptomyces sp. NBC_00868]|uniref:hypothetical protein n=1 Tax=Streptomyces sp. NBC_00868 TaxID=2903683 RepID=UPI00386FA553|nr:hypothetical protein OG239_42080 [Streptomyces sp. NBC_00868]